MYTWVMMTTKAKAFSDQIRAAIDGSGLSRYRICKEIGISEASMSRFMSGHTGLKLSTVNRLADLLGWKLSVPRRKGR